jgi:chemotaxis protein CheX
MNVNFINPFLEGTVDVLKTMAFVEPKVGKPFLKKTEKAIGDVTGIIGMTGAAKGSLALSFSEKCILKIVSNMLGEEHTTVNGEIKDAVGEITNMISGAARQYLEKQGYKITAAIPTIISGKSHQVSHVLGGPSIIIPFEIEEGSFVVDVCLADGR